MNFSKSMLIIGSIVVAFGLLFTSQSQTIVGPESSFMYRNPEWMVNGGIIAGVGTAIIIVGIVLKFKRL